MTALARDPEKAASTRFDLIIVGGGIQGACLALEASLRGVRSLLIERDDFGGKTSWNSLRIAHGGLRHLQRFDFAEARRSAREQAWWFRHFPDMVEPQPCLLPVYNRGARRLSVLRAALAVQAKLTASFASSSHSERVLPTGRILSVEETLARFPSAERRGLLGGALWYDGRFSNPQRLHIEILRWAVTCGAQVLNYVECDDLLVEEGRSIGVRAHCRETQRQHRFFGSIVVNTASTRATGSLGEAARESTDRGSALAFNVVLRRAPLSDCALAITPKRSGAPTYFAVPRNGRSAVGTVHLPERYGAGGGVCGTQVAAFLADLNSAVPEFNLSMDDVLEVHAGLLPAAKTGSARPATKARIIDHGDHGGVCGLVSVENVKYTNARWVAEQVLRGLFERHWKTPLWSDEGTPRPQPVALNHAQSADPSASDLAACLADESALHIDDFLLRRCDGDRDPEGIANQAQQLMRGLQWGAARRRAELKRLQEALRGFVFSSGAPASSSAVRGSSRVPSG